MDVGDMVYIRQSLELEDGRNGGTITVHFQRPNMAGRPARIIQLDREVAVIQFDDDGDQDTINIGWLAPWVEFVNIDQVETFLGDDRICGDRGPRMGAEGVMICKRPLNHEGQHKPAPDDGWGDQSW